MLAAEQLINIQLIPELQALDEVVVVGYGTMKRKRPYRGGFFCETGKDIADNQII